jgi:5-methylcytosine-specific restriction endonuclease McrA
MGANWRYDDKLVPVDLWKIAHRQKLICPLTGEHLNRDNISIDHIIPRSAGGKNVPTNIRLTTRDINWFKRTMNDPDLLAMCLKVVNHMGK